ncbi:hypothetical protein C0Q70_16167 [Pomacea canaliculata]|uniref:Uncharacterized protein n=1 Tax=Pomacea canaliculata TaxID=400727 RepID=A0A2T7NP10_POMCA|nr:hypothetical protein C0Q70_16167 [Pomacea canaliculata]
MKKKMMEEARSEEEIKKKTVRCPRCHMMVEKNGGAVWFLRRRTCLCLKENLVTRLLPTDDDCNSCNNKRNYR